MSTEQGNSSLAGSASSSAAVESYQYALRTQWGRCRQLSAKYGKDGIRNAQGGVISTISECAQAVGDYHRSLNGGQPGKVDSEGTTFQFSGALKSCKPCAGGGPASTEGQPGHPSWATYTLVTPDGKTQLASPPQRYTYERTTFGQRPCEHTSAMIMNMFPTTQVCMNQAATAGCDLVQYDTSTQRCRCCSSLNGANPGVSEYTARQVYRITGKKMANDEDADEGADEAVAPKSKPGEALTDVVKYRVRAYGQCTGFAVSGLGIPTVKSLGECANTIAARNESDRCEQCQAFQYNSETNACQCCDQLVPNTDPKTGGSDAVAAGWRQYNIVQANGKATTCVESGLVVTDGVTHCPADGDPPNPAHFRLKQGCPAGEEIVYPTDKTSTGADCNGVCQPAGAEGGSGGTTTPNPAKKTIVKQFSILSGNDVKISNVTAVEEKEKAVAGYLAVTIPWKVEDISVDIDDTATMVQSTTTTTTTNNRAAATTGDAAGQQIVTVSFHHEFDFKNEHLMQKELKMMEANIDAKITAANYGLLTQIGLGPVSESVTMVDNGVTHNGGESEAQGDDASGSVSGSGVDQQQQQQKVDQENGGSENNNEHDDADSSSANGSGEEGGLSATVVVMVVLLGVIVLGVLTVWAMFVMRRRQQQQRHNNESNLKESAATTSTAILQEDCPEKDASNASL